MSGVAADALRLDRSYVSRIERGNPSNKLHSWLSEDGGIPEALVHLGTVVGLMKIHNDYEEFEAQLDTIAPIYPDHPPHRTRK